MSVCVSLTRAADCCHSLFSELHRVFFKTSALRQLCGAYLCVCVECQPSIFVTWSKPREAAGKLGFLRPWGAPTAESLVIDMLSFGSELPTFSTHLSILLKDPRQNSDFLKNFYFLLSGFPGLGLISPFLRS